MGPSQGTLSVATCKLPICSLFIFRINFYWGCMRGIPPCWHMGGCTGPSQGISALKQPGCGSGHGLCSLTHPETMQWWLLSCLKAIPTPRDKEGIVWVGADDHRCHLLPVQCHPLC